MIKKLKLESAILTNIDKELEVPKAWLDGARKEGKLRIYSTFDPGQVEVLSRPFKERYPYINIEYSRASHEDRAIRSSERKISALSPTLNRGATCSRVRSTR